jgi:hypothetical protein
MGGVFAPLILLIGRVYIVGKSKYQENDNIPLVGRGKNARYATAKEREKIYQIMNDELEEALIKPLPKINLHSMKGTK